MNFKNLAENLIIVIVAFSAGGYIGYKASIESNRMSIELLTPTITEAIKKETTNIKNEITNDIDVKIHKVKKSDSLKINIVQDPNNDLKPKIKVESKKDTIVKVEKKKKRKKFLGIF